MIWELYVLAQKGKLECGQIDLCTVDKLIAEKNAEGPLLDNDEIPPFR